MQDFIGTLFVVIVGMAVVFAATFRAKAIERNFVLGALFMHFSFGILQWWMTENIFGISDVYWYLDEGRGIDRLLDERPFYWSFELLKLVCQLPSAVPMDPGPTSSMIVATSYLVWLSGSMWTTYVVCAFLGFIGKWALYSALRDELEATDLRPLLVFTLLVPSCVFWTAGLVKEAFALCGLGILFRGTQLLLRSFNPVAALLVPVGALLVASFKPFLLFAFVIAFAVWVVFAKAKRLSVFAPFFLALVIAAAIGGIALLGRTFKEFAVGNVGEALADHQLYGEIGAGGSYYQMGNPEARSLGGQLVYAPLALVTTLMRPFLFEIHNAQAAAAALELFVMTILLGASLRRSGLKAAWANIFGRPVLVFAFVFTVVAGIGVGLATTNFGTLSRYRAPLLPFYFALIAGIRQEERRSGEATSEEPEEPPIDRAELRRRLARRGHRRGSRIPPARGTVT